MNINKLFGRFLILGISLIFSNTIDAASRIAVLDFELRDITSLPNTPEELMRTASIKPLLEEALKNEGEFEIIQINFESQQTANAGVGYLFNFNDTAAALGQQFGADWVIVGLHSKPSFLFSYLMVHLINVKNRMLSASYNVELKGNHAKVTEHGVNVLANKLDAAIAKFYR